MDFSTPQSNLLLAWLWIVLGFGSGLVLGLFFHREEWLGGYGSLQRRLYRLGHISFFGLGVLNLCFYLTVRQVPLAEPWLGVASWALITGALSMPLCCAVMAHFPRAHSLFALPVASLLLGGMITLVGVARAAPDSARPDAPLYSNITAVSAN